MSKARLPSGAGLIVLCAVLLLVAVSCVPPRRVAPNPMNRLRTVAVLPMYNATNDVEGPKKVRELAADRVENWHYAAMPFKEVDTLLSDSFGVSLGAQLEEIEPARVGEALGADALLYGYLIDYDSVTTGVYNVKKVRAGFRLVDAKSGKTIWAGGLGVKNVLTGGGNVALGAGVLKDIQEAREGADDLAAIKGLDSIPGIKRWHVVSRVHLDKGAAEAGVLALGEKLVGKAVGFYMRLESDVMLNMIFEDFPPGPGRAGVVRTAEGLRPYPTVLAPLDPTGGPAFSVLALDRRDFTADISLTLSGVETRFDAGTVERRGNLFRFDLVETSSPSGPAEPRRRRTIVIHRGDEMKTYVLYPEVRRYVEYSAHPRAVIRPRLDKRPIGIDLVYGGRAEKSRVDIYDAQGVRSGFVWASTEHDGFPVRTEFHDGAVLEMMELRNIRFFPPSPSHFRVPPDYTRSEGPEDLVPGQGHDGGAK